MLISIQPLFVEKILSGEKVFEFRRVWAKNNPSTLVIYSSSPEQRIVAIAHVSAVHCGSPSYMWSLARNGRGGITRKLLREYFSGRKTGYAIEIERVVTPLEPVDPKSLFGEFRPPQSFQFLDAKQYKKILTKFSME